MKNNPDTCEAVFYIDIWNDLLKAHFYIPPF